MHCEYEDNPFCSRLSDEDRAVLCKYCQVFTFSKKMDPKVRCPQISAQLLYPGEDNCTLILRGMIYTSNVRGEDSSRAYIISQPGDIMRLETVFGECDVLELHCNWHYLSDGAYAIFSSKILKDLFLRSPQFASALFQCSTTMRTRQNSFLLETQLQNAYSALMYVLLLCKENGIKPLTHQELAHITNLNRTTVTKTLKSILAREDLSISLQDYIKSAYMED